MGRMGLLIVFFLGIVTIEKLFVMGVSPEVQLGSMEIPTFPERPVLFTSPSDVKNYLDSLGKKISFNARQRYGKRATLQALRDLNSRRMEVPPPHETTQEEQQCNCERMQK